MNPQDDIVLAYGHWRWLTSQCQLVPSVNGIQIIDRCHVMRFKPCDGSRATRKVAIPFQVNSAATFELLGFDSNTAEQLLGMVQIRQSRDYEEDEVLITAKFHIETTRKEWRREFANGERDRTRNENSRSFLDWAGFDLFSRKNDDIGKGLQDLGAEEERYAAFASRQFPSLIYADSAKYNWEDALKLRWCAIKSIQSISRERALNLASQLNSPSRSSGGKGSCAVSAI